MLSILSHVEKMGSAGNKIFEYPVNAQFSKGHVIAGMLLLS